MKLHKLVGQALE